ncbi:alpha/beta fold hydrolase [Nocardia huaxiensis]|uniref:Alpha/beta fold hydrolase n=1 Tax=Nocardia huaxiensis TaxID=2755382 RepID=A0A7D6VF62_9NOCA|nr:alpha/beta fold hydrolase [Nocardia huaxiensis]QLY28716.1 alpha/beta fold hydrolase [Nocardia huaxiensis]UFS97808.1 alpha/beta fold hydrolase [Nocardia huaxiensis]
MTEQIAEVGRGISLAYHRSGDEGGVPLLFIAGLGQQYHEWPDGLCRLLVERGYHVIRFDNRDVGKSTHATFRPPGPGDLLRRRWHPDQYDIGDLAGDTVGLLDALGLESAHLVGMSMGGMIAQTIAARAPRRVTSLTSIMSTTGALRLGRPALSTWRLMFAEPARTRDAHIEAAVRIWRHICAAGYPFDEQAVRAAAALTWDRDEFPAPGVGRQLAGIFKSGNRTRELRTITAPTLVVHGDRDRMVNPSGGAATARAIPGARRHTVPGMGHDLPVGLWPLLTDLIDDHVRSAARSSDVPNL